MATGCHDVMTILLLLCSVYMMPHKIKIRFGLKLRKVFKLNNIAVSDSLRFTLKGIKAADTVEIEPNCSFLEGRQLWTMGAFSYCYSSLPENTVVGRYCSIAAGVKVLGSQHPIERFTTSTVTYSKYPFILSDWGALKQVEFNGESEDPITIGNDVWIGGDVILKPGITIGDGAVIAQNALVTKDIPPYTIVGGIPAKKIRDRFDKKSVSDLLRLEWWKYSCLDFKDYPVDSDIHVFIKYLENSVENNSLAEFSPEKIKLERFK